MAVKKYWLPISATVVSIIIVSVLVDTVGTFRSHATVEQLRVVEHGSQERDRRIRADFKEHIKEVRLEMSAQKEFRASASTTLEFLKERLR